MKMFRTLLAACILTAAVAACGETPTAVTPEAAGPRFDSGLTAGSGNRDDGKMFGTGHVLSTSGTTTTLSDDAVADSTLDGRSPRGFGSGH